MRAESVVRSVGAAAVAAMLVLAGAGEARAQDFGMDAGAGVSFPMGNLADVWDPGATFGLGLVAHVSPKVALRADGDLAFQPGRDVGAGRVAPDLTEFRYTGGIEVRFTDPEVADWYTVLGLGLGAATMDTDAFRLPGGQTVDFNNTYLTTYGAVRIVYRVNPHVAFSLRGRLYLTAMDRADTRVFESLGAGQVEGLEDEWTLPVQLRTEITF